jgi:hypothetical protein
MIRLLYTLSAINQIDPSFVIIVSSSFFTLVIQLSRERDIYSHPNLITPHPAPVTAHAAVNKPSIDTTCSLPLTASLNFCTKGTRVCSFSFQKFAMCWRAKNSIAVFAAAAEIRMVGSDVLRARMGVRKEIIN